MTWAPPRIATEEQAGEARPLDKFDGPAFAAKLASELSRMLGTRIGIRPAAEEENTLDDNLVALATIGLPNNSLVEVALGDRLTGLIVERVFGTRLTPSAEIAGTRARELAPGTATWRAISTLFGKLAADALQAGGIVPDQKRLRLPPRVADAASSLGAQTAFFRVTLGEEECWMRLAAREEAARQPEPEKIRQAMLWRLRAEAGTRRIPMLVALHMPEKRVPLSQVLALRPGDVLPIERPRALTLVVNGEALSTVPAEQFFNTVEEPQ